MGYKISDQAPPLANLLVAVATEVAAAHPTMQETVRARCETHNACINLLTAQGEYAELWDAPTLDAEGNPIHQAWDPEQFAVPLDSICLELRSKQSPAVSSDRTDDRSVGL